MTDYESMYRVLFNCMTNAVRNIENQNYGFARLLLINAQQQAEEFYMQADGETDGAAPA